MSYGKGDEVKHTLCPQRVGVVVGGSWWPDDTSGTFFQHVFWAEGDKTMIRPELIEQLPTGTIEFDLSEFQGSLNA